MRRHELTDEEWAVIAPLLPTNSRGIERVDDRRVINGTRFLTEKNRSTLMDMIGGLSAAQKSKIVLMR